jgi:hypothetical protein
MQPSELVGHLPLSPHHAATCMQNKNIQDMLMIYLKNINGLPNCCMIADLGGLFQELRRIEACSGIRSLEAEVQVEFSPPVLLFVKSLSSPFLHLFLSIPSS